MSIENELAVKNAGGEAPDNLIRMIKHGKVEGKRNKKTLVIEWLGVPYAKPPVKELRWKAPQNPDQWEGILETRQYRQSCVQMYDENIIGSEDCLYLNIWRPDNKQTNLPVLVFVHGGGNTYGSSQDFKGDFLAQQTNSIIISVNYRLGVMGWFRHAALTTGNQLNDSGNYGLLDIFHSLKWVQENIESFGGDRNNVTLGGHSAGGRNVMAALISPIGRGLFQKAVVLSGGMTTSTPAAGEKKASEILSKLLMKEGKVSTKDEARKWESETSSEKVASYLRGKDPGEFLPLIGDPAIKMDPFPHLFTDGHVVPTEGFQLLKYGRHNKIPIILGCTANEFSTFAYFDPFFQSSANKSMLSNHEKLNLYQHSKEYGSRIYAGFNVDTTADMLTMFAEQPPVYAYQFAWGTRQGVVSPEIQNLFGAPHGSDIDFFTGHEQSLLGQLFPNTYYTDENKPGRKKLNKIMVTYLKNFMCGGNPNMTELPKWEPWQSEKEAERILTFDADNERALVRMSKQHIRKEEIVKEMKEKLSKKESQIIERQLFDQRFFWDASF